MHNDGNLVSVNLVVLLAVFLLMQAYAYETTLHLTYITDSYIICFISRLLLDEYLVSIMPIMKNATLTCIPYRLE